MTTTPAPVAAPAPRITVRQALDLPVLRRGMPDVLAGADRLDRPIRWVHAGEVDYIASMLRGGELLLTTGLGIGKRVADQRRFVAGLADKGIAALAIELGHSFPTMPDAIVQSARQHDLPLVALHREVPFVSVTEAIHREIVHAHYALLRRGDDVHRRLTELLLAGQGIPEVLAATAELVDNPVFLEDGDGRLLFHAAGPHHAGDATPVDPLDAWTAAKGDGRAPWRAGLAAPVPHGPSQAAGRLLALPLRGPLDERAEVVLERAAGIVALSLLRARQEEELVARERGDFLVDLAAGRIAGRDAQRQARSIGFAPAGPQLLPVAAESDAAAGSAAWSLVLRDAQTELDGRGTVALIGQRGRPGRLLGLVALREDQDRAAVADGVADALRTAAGRRLGAGELLVAVGLPVAWPDAGRGLQLTEETASAAASLPPARWHDAGALELQRLLWRWRDDAEVAAFVRRRLGALLEHDAQRKHALLPTLEALCANGWRKAETARALHLNRQALYNRLTRLEQLLGVDLSDPEQTMTVHLALRALPYVEPDATTAGPRVRG
ncbi:PucR family transcriptional regulator [Patulibacter brassicae]|uniref:PucR family transcriptional regulator n=1 Tax=Patulibacter brassicae TaxID=1705717 RepID=A0ABU4VR15_9ACTN|nr:PucR family transcriptional regulator [Patulibacter brassicae]MDX8153812.1 PucR family transcriptional regulator [Patulibacter brassicae]